MSRIQHAAKNIFYGYIGNILIMVLKFVSRTVFINSIGITYLGINGLYINILSVLSFAELGIGTAMNYSLYKPVADNDISRIKSLMLLYKKAYRWIASLVAVIGISLIPFLKFIIKDPVGIESNELVVYYVIFLFNTVSTYLIAYKYSLVNADQKNYVQTNFQSITILITTIIQVFVLLKYKNFLLYLLAAALIELIQKIFVNKYINLHYPYLLDRSVKELTKNEREPIFKNVRALIFHKIGDVSIYQTDNILISSFINVATVGLISNYTLIISSVTSFLNIIFNSLISSFGNLIATEDSDRQYHLFKVYRFIGFWCYGFASISFLILITPFIELWIGHDMIITNVVINLIVLDYYMKGHRTVVNNFKTASGIFNEDKYIGIIQAIVNLTVSIVMVKLVGLPGIYIGTVAQGVVSTMSKPYIVYKKAFNRSVKEYYKDSLIYLVVLFIPLALLLMIKSVLLPNSSFYAFALLTICVLIIPNTTFLIAFKKREELQYLKDIVRSRIWNR